MDELTNDKRVVLVRYGEIGLKGRNRPLFENSLVRNIRRAIDDERVVVLKEHGRIIIELRGNEAELRRILDRVRSVFGVVSVSPAVTATLSIDAIGEVACTLVQKYLRRVSNANGGPHTFKVETRRPNKHFPMQSPEVCRVLGGIVLERFPELQVDVHAPDFTLAVEIRSDCAYVYTEVLAGEGGLPVGTSGKALLLLSGGIDSPVAGWLTQKRGIALEAVYFHTFPYTSERALQKVVDLAAILERSQGRKVPLHVVDFTPTQQQIESHIPVPSRITVMRRMMVRIARSIALKRRIPALVTGESIGQVASQTLESMAAINAVTNMPIIRPLVTMDKREIVDRAKVIGTYDVSILPYDDCCTLFVPDRPETKPKIDRIEQFESHMDIEELVTDAVSSR